MGEEKKKIFLEGNRAVGTAEADAAPAAQAAASEENRFLR